MKTVSKLKILHPYTLSLFTALFCLITLIYFGIINPNLEKNSEEVKGISQDEIYTKTLLSKENNSDLIITDQAGIFDGKYIDQQEVSFTAYSEATITYDLFKITNKTNNRISLRITPKTVTNPNMKKLKVKMLVDGGSFELYTYSQKPNQDYFAISLDPYQSEDIRLLISSYVLDTETVKGQVLFQIVEM